MTTRSYRLLPLLTLLLLCPLPAAATSVVLLGEEDMVQRSTWILRGVVLSVETAVRSRGFPVFQDVSMEVVDVLKGTWPEPVLHFGVPGGELDGKVHLVPGMPQFHPGEDVLVFLTLLPSGEKVVVGLRQGKYHLEPDPSTGIVHAVRSLEHLNVVPQVQPGQTVRQALSSGAPNREAWGSLRARIRGLVRDQVRGR